MRTSTYAKHWPTLSGILTTAACIAVASLGSSCNLDPVHHAAEASLGDEDASKYPVNSEYHRPGQPCVLCHSDRGSAAKTFALAGTVFWGEDSAWGGVANAYVTIRDAGGSDYCLVTNCAGNFFLEGDSKTLTYPLKVFAVERKKNPGPTETSFMKRAMTGHIGREPSCATCHLKDIVDFGSPGNVRIYTDRKAFEAAKAAGDPIEVTACPPPDPVKLTCVPAR